MSQLYSLKDHMRSRTGALSGANANLIAACGSAPWLGIPSPRLYPFELGLEELEILTAIDMSKRFRTENRNLLFVPSPLFQTYEDRRETHLEIVI